MSKVERVGNPKSEEKRGFFGSLVSRLNPFSSSGTEETLAQETATPPPTPVAEIVGRIDEQLKKEGKEVAGLPPAPEMAPVFKTAGAKDKRPSEAKALTSPSTNGLIANIDAGLKQKGIEAPKTTLPPPTGPANEQETVRKAEKQETKKKVELDTKLTLEKGPLFLDTGELQAREKGQEDVREKAQEAPAQPPEIPQAVVKGPPQPVKEKALETKVTERKKPAEEEEESPGLFEQIKRDLEAVGKVLNPFSW